MCGGQWGWGVCVCVYVRNGGMGKEWRKRKTVQEKCCSKINLCHVFLGISFQRGRGRGRVVVKNSKKERRTHIHTFHSKKRQWAVCARTRSSFDAFADFVWCRFSSFFFRCTTWMIRYTIFFSSLFCLYFSVVIFFVSSFDKKQKLNSIECASCVYVCVVDFYIAFFIAIENVLFYMLWWAKAIVTLSLSLNFASLAAAVYLHFFRKNIHTERESKFIELFESKSSNILCNINNNNKKFETHREKS